MITHSQNRSSESGQTIVLFALALTVLIGFLALTFDIGMMALDRRSAQNAADAAALAGAQMLPNDPDAAIADATAYAALNGFSADEISAITVSSTYATNDTIEVALSRDVDFAFAPVLGLSSGTVNVSATAATGGVVGVALLAPLAVEQAVFDGLSQGDTATLKYNAQNSSDGNFLPLALDGTGSSEYEENLMLGSEQWLCSVGSETANCASEVTTQPGNMVGKTVSALDWIFANTSDDCDTYDEVFPPSAGDPSRLSIAAICNKFTNPSAASYQLILVPVIDTLCNGSCTVTVQEFALFFIESYTCSGPGQGNSCDLIGKYVQANANVLGLLGAYDDGGSINSVRLIK
ncbi:MAG: pilus assembly protein [Chloroflexi bacterium]|nr:pilus assembly protein [Chloroflexota bacterium]